MNIRYVALVVSLMGAAGMASADGGYVGIGALSGKVSVPGLSTSMLGVSVTASGDTTTRTGYKLFGGYNFNKNWGVEAAYNDLGSGYSIKGNAGGVPFSITGMKAYSYQIAGVGTLPVSEQFSLFAKLGVASNHSNGGTATVAGTTLSVGSKTRSQALYGVGADWSFTKNWAARVEYENYGKLSSDDFWGVGSSGAIKGSAWTLSAKYSF